MTKMIKICKCGSDKWNVYKESESLGTWEECSDCEDTHNYEYK